MRLTESIIRLDARMRNVATDTEVIIDFLSYTAIDK
jgi:hypothetical protein